VNFFSTEKKYNGATFYVYRCEECGKLVKTTIEGLIPKCKCYEVGNTYGTLLITDIIDNHIFQCYCHDCHKYYTMSLICIKKYQRCPSCLKDKVINTKKIINKETSVDTTFIGKIFGGLEVLEKEKDSKLFICRCECGNICKVSKPYLTRSNPSNRIIGCDICRTRTQPMKYQLYKQLSIRYDIRFTLNDFTTFINKAVKNNFDVSYDKTKLLRSIFTLQDFVLTKKEEQNESR